MHVLEVVEHSAPCQDKQKEQAGTIQTCDSVQGKPVDRLGQTAGAQLCLLKGQAGVLSGLGYALT